jgi:hypothetical protein
MSDKLVFTIGSRRAHRFQRDCVRVFAASNGQSAAEKRLAELRKAQERSDQAVSWRSQAGYQSGRAFTGSDSYDDAELGRAPRNVDIRMYEGLAQSRNRLAKHLNEVKRKASTLEETIQKKDDALVAAFDCLTRTLSEYKNLQNLSSGAAAGIQFGVNQEDALRKILILQERIEFMHEV